MKNCFYYRRSGEGNDFQEVSILLFFGGDFFICCVDSRNNLRGSSFSSQLKIRTRKRRIFWFFPSPFLFFLRKLHKFVSFLEMHRSNPHREIYVHIRLRRWRNDVSRSRRKKEINSGKWISNLFVYLEECQSIPVKSH